MRKIDRFISQVKSTGLKIEAAGPGPTHGAISQINQDADETLSRSRVQVSNDGAHARQFPKDRREERVKNATQASRVAQEILQHDEELMALQRLTRN